MKNTIAESMQRSCVPNCASQTSKILACFEKVVSVLKLHNVIYKRDILRQSIHFHLKTSTVPLRHSPTLPLRHKHKQQYKHRQPYDTLMNDKTDCSNTTSRYLLTNEKQRNLSGVKNALVTHTYKDAQYLRQSEALCPLGYLGTRVYAHINCVPSNILHLFLMHENEFMNYGISIFHLSRCVQKYNSKYFRNNINYISQPSRAKLAQLHKLASNSQGYTQVDRNWHSLQETQPDCSSIENSTTNTDLDKNRDMSQINSAEMLGLNEHRDMSPISISPANNANYLGLDECFKLSAIENAIAFDLNRFRDPLPIKNETTTELEEQYDLSVLNNENASNLIERDYSGGVDLHRIRFKETLESISSDMGQKLKKNTVIPVPGKCISPLYLDLPNVNIDLTVVPVHLITFEPFLTILSKISDGQMPPPHVTMRYELLRLCTFRTYPTGDKPFFLSFAAAGFYYAAKGDEVVCYCCAVRKSNWTGDQVPMDIHRNLTPTCSFLLKNSEVNVSVLKSQTPSGNRLQRLENESSSSTRLNASTSNQLAFVKTPTTVSEVTHPSTNLVSRTHQTDQPVRMPRDNNMVNYSNMEASSSPAHLQQNVLQSPSNQHVLQNSSLMETALDAVTVHLPKHSKFSTKESRSKSYNESTSTFAVPVDALSDAGFFYAGFGDCVRCFYCGIGLRNWTPEDDPWIEHARWSKNCHYVKQMKGKEYVNLVQLAVQYTQNASILLGESSSNEEAKSPSTRKTAEANINFARSPTQDDSPVQNQNISTKEETTARQSSATTTAMSKPTNSSGEFKHSHKKNQKIHQQKLLQENERLKQQSICTECKRNGVCIVFLPCGHLITCEQCAPKVEHCSMCQKIVKGTVRTYFS